MRSWRSQLPWLVVAACVLLAAPTAAAPDSSAASSTYLLGSVLVVVCTCWGAWSSHGSARLPWVLIAATTSCWLAGDALQRVLVALGVGGGDVGAPDALWLMSYPLLGAAVVLVVRARGLSRPVLQAVALDSTVAAAAAGAIAWQFLVEPALRGGGSPAVLVIRSLYPLGDVGVFALALTLFMLPGRRAAPTALLLVCLGMTLPLDLLYTLVLLVAPAFDPGRIDAAFLVVNGCLGAAAVHRDRAALSTPAPQGGQGRVQRWRVLLLGASVTAVLVSAVLRHGGAWNPVPSLLAAIVVACTVVIRFYLLVAEQEQARAALQHQAHHDQLTGAANRVLLQQRVAAALGGEGVALFSFDLDGFKAVNDAHGHRGGDVVLCAVAARLQAAVRAHDTVARVGGDEFVVLCSDVPVGALQSVGQRLVEVIRQPVQIGGVVVGVGASVGVVALGPEVTWSGPSSASSSGAGAGRGRTEDGVDHVLRIADEAMYQAKRGGGGVVCATPAMRPVTGATEPASASPRR